MPHLGLDALVKASRAVNIPTREARDQNRTRLAGRIAIGVAGGAVASGAREATAAIAGGATAGPVAGGSIALGGGLAKWAVVSIWIAVGSAAGVGAYVARDHVSLIPALAAPVPSTAAAGATAMSEPVGPSSRAAALLLPAPDSDLPTGSDVLRAASPAAVPGTESRVHSQPPAGPGSSTVQARSFDGELRLLRSARRALDTGSPAQALALLDRYAAEFPHGTLKPECQATRVLALCAAGRVASAQNARDQFMNQQPGSPLAEGLRATCGGGP